MEIFYGGGRGVGAKKCLKIFLKYYFLRKFDLHLSILRSGHHAHEGLKGQNQIEKTFIYNFF